jgi:hypothetical protein
MCVRRLVKSLVYPDFKTPCACHTAVGKHRTVEAIQGMASCFMLTCCNSVRVLSYGRYCRRRPRRNNERPIEKGHVYIAAWGRRVTKLDRARH